MEHQSEGNEMQFGAHQSISGGVFNAVLLGQKAGCDTIQMFNKSSNQWRAKKLGGDEVNQFFKTIEDTGVSVATSHTSYLINIASPDSELNAKSCAALKEEMERCNLLKIPNLVMHPGSHVGTGEDAGLQRIAKNINKLFDELSDNRCCLLLETTAGQGSNLGSKFEHLAYIIDQIEDKTHIGVCFDTCHVFAAGYAITEKADYRRTMKQFDEIVGLDRLRIIHMNDSQKPFASQRDRHEHIGKGCIGLEAFRNIVNDARFKKTPKILETPKGDDVGEDIENLRVLRSLLA